MNGYLHRSQRINHLQVTNVAMIYFYGRQSSAGPSPYRFFPFLAAAQRFRCASAILWRAAGLSGRLAFFLAALADPDFFPGLADFSFVRILARTLCNRASSLSIAAIMAVLLMKLPPVTFYLDSGLQRSRNKDKRQFVTFVLTSDPSKRILGSYADP
jgi:hypothetical protein